MMTPEENSMTNVPKEILERIKAILRWDAFRVYPIKGPVPDAEKVLYELKQHASLKGT